MTMENEKTPEMTTETLNTDLYSSFIDPLCKSLNYKHLNPPIEKNIEKIPNIVFQEIQNIPSNKNKFLQEKENALIDLSPEKTDLYTYYQTLKRNYNNKIKNQENIRLLLKNYQEDNITFPSLCQKGETLINEGNRIEPMFFAITELAKQQVETEAAKIINVYGAYLSSEEKLLISTPLATDFFTKRFLDVQNFLENPSLEKKDLLKIRYGQTLFDKKWYKQQKLDKPCKEEIESNERRKFCKKSYFLLNRKIPNLERIDYILTIDHIVDKHIQANFAFLHDIFLKMQILHGHEKISRIVSTQHLGELTSNSERKLLKAY